jgi:hypothetical protein
MEREKELIKLINVLRRTSRMALQSEWTGGSQDAAAYCTDQYNRVLARLKDLDGSVATVFDALPAGSSLTVVAMASRQLTAYFEDEVGATKGFGRGYGFNFDPSTFKGSKSFREFWEKGAREFEDLGEFIRESIEEWTRQRKKQPEDDAKKQ